MEEDYGFIMNKPQQVETFEKMLDDNLGVYFDVDDFEQIIDYYHYESLFEKAIHAAELAIDLHPASIPLKLRIASLLASSNDEKGALSLINEIENSEPDNVDIYLTKGAIYSQLKEYKKAIDAYNKALPIAEEPDYICCNIAFEYENLGEYNKTIEYLKKALDYNPDNYVAMFEAAYCFDLLSLNEESITFFLKHIDKHPYSTEAWFNLGVSYNNANMHEKAIEALDYCHVILEDHKPAFIQKAFAYSGLNQFDKAIECYKNSADNIDDNPMVLYYIAEAYEKMENFTQAIAYYNQAIELDEDITDAWIGLGVCELEAGNTSKAIRYMLKGLSMDQENTSYLCLVADAYHSAGDKENCIKYYEKALYFDSIDAETWFDYADSLISFREFEESISVIVRGTEAIKEMPAFNYRMAVCLYFSGKHGEADFFLEEALREDIGFQDYKILEKYPELSSFDSYVRIIGSFGP